jgi:DNA-binding beta-propeller fold protein YncE
MTACVVALAALFGGAGSALLGVCGPFTDVSDATFCPFVLEIFTLGITTGTSPTTYDPTGTVNRLQMAAFLSRTVDGVLRRGARRATLNQFWTTESNAGLARTTVGSSPEGVASDGEDLWVANLAGFSISRVHASDGRLLETWTGATAPVSVLPAVGKIFVAGNTTPGRLYRIDPDQPPGAVTTVASNLGGGSIGIAYDGRRIWTANSNNSVSIVTPGEVIPWTVTTVTAGFGSMIGAVYDGANIWVTRTDPGTLLKLDPAGAILQTVTLGITPFSPAFDGANLWVPNHGSSSVSVVRVSNGSILATLTGNGLDQPWTAAFDGQRILVTNFGEPANSVSLWKAADLTPMGVFSTGAFTRPLAACTDGINFWITLNAPGHLARF